MCKKLVVCLALLMASVSFGDVVVGNWENAMDGWTTISGTVVGYSTYGATLDASSLNVAAPAGWNQTIVSGSIQPYLYANIPWQFSVDVSVKASEWDLDGGWLKLIEGVVFQCEGNGWWGQVASSGADWTGVDQTTTFVFNIPANANINGAKIIILGADNPIGDFGTRGTLYYDNAKIIIPEPATIAMLGLGGLALIRRKK